MTFELTDFEVLGVEFVEEIPEPPDPFDPSDWEVLIIFKESFWFDNWQPVEDSVLLWNLPTDKFWDAWNTLKAELKLMGFQVRPNLGEHAQDTDAEWLVYFDRHQHLDFLDDLAILERSFECQK
ncbi:hypothetical protein J5I95_13715 [Candidatus Poribacteria bacterium]|nr:hypothetical protein [Candidatus Poribacteria bacterium]